MYDLQKMVVLDSVKQKIIRQIADNNEDFFFFNGWMQLKKKKWVLVR